MHPGNQAQGNSFNAFDSSDFLFWPKLKTDIKMNRMNRIDLFMIYKFTY